MAVVSIIGHKGGVGKTTLSINIAAAITKAMHSTQTEAPVCLFDLDLKLPTITSILNSHPQKTFFNLFHGFRKCTLVFRTFSSKMFISLRFLRGDIDFDPRRASGATPRDSGSAAAIDRFSII